MNSQISEGMQGLLAQELCEMMTFAGFGIYILDMDGIILDMDKRAFCIFALNDLYSEPNSITGKNIVTLTASGTLLKNLLEKTKKDHQIQGLRYSFDTSSGQIKHAENYLSLVQSKKQIVGLVREITDPEMLFKLSARDKNAIGSSQRLEPTWGQRLEPTWGQRLEPTWGQRPEPTWDAINQEMNSLVYAISHDMRAPIRSIEGFSSAMSEDYEKILDEVGRDFLNRIQKAGKKLDQYIEALLNMSRETRGEIIIEKVNLSHMAKEILHEFKENQPDRKTELVIQENIIVMADRRLAKILLRKLLENAWKFVLSNDLTRIEFKAAEKDGKQVCLIRDNGVGFDMKYAKPRLFGMFQRMHDDSFEGIGAGLATVRRIMNRHAGEIWAESQVGKGTSIYFSF